MRLLARLFTALNAWLYSQQQSDPCELCGSSADERRSCALCYRPARVSLP